MTDTRITLNTFRNRRSSASHPLIRLLLLLFSFLIIHRGDHKRVKQWMRSVRTTFELGVELTAEHEGMVP